MNQENAAAKRVLAITMVKNEQDIIESFVRHTLSFADELLVCDHQSTDATREILGNLKAEGLPLDIRTEYRAEYAQATFMNALLCEAAEQRQADFIVPLDADEFLLPETTGDLREKIEALSPDTVYALSWRKYVPLGGRGGTRLRVSSAVGTGARISVERQMYRGRRCCAASSFASRAGESCRLR